VVSSTRALIRVAKNRVRIPLRLRRKRRFTAGNNYVEPL
jgi:hypothetical protein